MARESHPSRRTYLKYTGAAAIVTFAGCSGGGGNGDGGTPEPNHQVPHPNDSKVPDSEATAKALEGDERDPALTQKKSADTVDFQHRPDGDKHCGNCEEFVPDQNDDGFGACLKVAGKIHSCDSCALYAGPYEGDDAVSCSM